MKAIEQYFLIMLYKMVLINTLKKNNFQNKL